MDQFVRGNDPLMPLIAPADRIQPICPPRPELVVDEDIRAAGQRSELDRQRQQRQRTQPGGQRQRARMRTAGGVCAVLSDHTVDHRDHAEYHDQCEPGKYIRQAGPRSLCQALPGQCRRQQAE